MKKISMSVLSFLISFAAFAAEDLPKLRQVNEHIFRSGRPTEKGLTYLKESKGLRTIINLESSESNVANEKIWAEKLGITYYSFPTSSWSKPKDQAIDQVLELLNDPSMYPILLHCKHGEDRTGMVTGLYRVFTDGWAPERAYQEMLDLGFHPILFNLDRYFKKRSGFQDYWSFDKNMILNR